MIIDKNPFWTSRMWKTFLIERFIKIPCFDKIIDPMLYFPITTKTVSVDI
jgi:hypothetical protein